MYEITFAGPVSRDLPPLFPEREAIAAAQVAALCERMCPPPSAPEQSTLWTLEVRRDQTLQRRITVLACSSEAALCKGREQLDDGEALSFCFSDPASEYLGCSSTSGIYQPR